MSLTISNLRVSFRDEPVLDGFNLNVNSGERFAIMGPSGSGKSTLLRAIAGLTSVDHGSIMINNVEMTNVQAHIRPVGLMFQDYALFPHMNVIENIGYGLKMSGVGSDDRDTRSRELLDLVGLVGFAERRTTTLSGGEKQRVALARTLAPSPSVVLLDEPLGSLDVSLKESVLTMTREILDSVGATSIYVTHDKSEVFAFCDRMAVLHNGDLVRVGRPDEIWDDPRSEFVSRSIGHRNLIPLSELGTELGIEIARELASERYTDNDYLVSIPEEAINVQSGGRLLGVVVANRFIDGSYIVEVSIGDNGTVLEVGVHENIEVGSELRLDIDTESLITLPKDD